MTNSKYIPHVIEPSCGVDRLFLALLVSAYRYDHDGMASIYGMINIVDYVGMKYREETVDGEKRTVLGFHPRYEVMIVVV